MKNTHVTSFYIKRAKCFKQNTGHDKTEKKTSVKVTLIIMFIFSVFDYICYKI